MLLLLLLRVCCCDVVVALVLMFLSVTGLCILPFVICDCGVLHGG